MSKEKNEDKSVFDVQTVRELIELMHEHDLNEVQLRQGEKRIKLRRGMNSPAVFSPQMQQVPVAAAPAAQPAAAAAAAPAEDDGNFEMVVSPTVGTFYSRPSPDKDDFVKVGDVVNADTVVCLVEAMKMFNEIQAGVSGKVVARLVNNEDPVDVNKPLFKIEPA